MYCVLYCVKDCVLCCIGLCCVVLLYYGLLYCVLYSFHSIQKKQKTELEDLLWAKDQKERTCFHYLASAPGMMSLSPVDAEDVCSGEPCLNSVNSMFFFMFFVCFFLCFLCVFFYVFFCVFFFMFFFVFFFGGVKKRKEY